MKNIRILISHFAPAVLGSCLLLMSAAHANQPPVYCFVNQPDQLAYTTDPGTPTTSLAITTIDQLMYMWYRSPSLAEQQLSYVTQHGCPYYRGPFGNPPTVYPVTYSTGRDQFDLYNFGLRVDFTRNPYTASGTAEYAAIINGTSLTTELVGPYTVPAYNGSAMLQFSHQFVYSGTAETFERKLYGLPMCKLEDPITGAYRAWFPPSGPDEATACPDTLDDIKSDSDSPPCDGTGNPIYPLTGAKKESIDTGIIIGGNALSLLYDSTKELQSYAKSRLPSFVPNAALFGFGGMWGSSFHKRLIPANSVVTSYVVQNGDGTQITFAQNGTALVADPWLRHTLVATQTGYVYTDGNTGVVNVYDQTGKLLTATSVDGRMSTYSYSTGQSPVAPNAGYLLSVTDDSGRSVSFSYALPAGGDSRYDGYVSLIVDPNGNTIVPTYDANRNLSSLTWQDGTIKSFIYDNTTFLWALTGIVDERAKRYSTYGYDAYGLAISTEHAGGVEKYSVNYAVSPTPFVNSTVNLATGKLTSRHSWQSASGISITKPNGSVVQMGSVVVNGKPLVSGTSQPAGSGCLASNSSTTYDSNRNILSRDDFTGMRTCYAYDSANHPITQVEGLSNTTDCATVLPVNSLLPAGSRKTLTQWHPDWNLPTQIQTSGSITTTVYNGQPDPSNNGQVLTCSPIANLPNAKPAPLVCKVIVQGRLSNGAIDSTTIQVTQYSYDARGNMLSTVSPRGKVSTAAYYTDTSYSGAAPNQVGHSLGDLMSVTNALGHRTTFDTYDASGRLIQSTDAKGETTTNAYDRRGRLVSKSTQVPGLAAKLTTLSYDPAGLLIGKTNPDGTSESYVYDDAHRLIKTIDRRGNINEFVLDNDGNRTTQSIKDATGVVQRTISRVYDALNRVQQVSGADQ